MSLVNEVLSEERRVLSRLGCDLNEQNADKNHPDTYYIDYSLNLFLGKRQIWCPKIKAAGFSSGL